jgi:hypothetical protein
MDVVRARWSSSSFLLYAGAFVVLFALVALLGWLSTDYGDGAFFGWSALVFVVMVVVAGGFQANGHAVTAGLFAFVALIAFSVMAGAFLSLINVLGDDDEPFRGFNWGLWLLELAIITAAFVLLATFRFPLFVLPIAVLGWFFLVDLVSGGGDWSAIVSIIVGFFFLLIGAGADRAYGFWVQVVAGLAIGGGFVYLWHSADWEWILIGLIALFYFVIAGALERSSYAVLGALGLYLAWSHFVDKWTDTSVSTPFYGEELTPSLSEEGTDSSVWGAALLYALYGLALVVVGLWLERRRPAETADQTSS